MKKFFKRLKELIILPDTDGRIILRVRKELVKESYPYHPYWGKTRIMPAEYKDVFLLVQMGKPEDDITYEEVEFKHFVQHLNFLEMISNSAFWCGYFSNKKLSKHYTKKKIRIRKTSDGGWIKV